MSKYILKNNGKLFVISKGGAFIEPPITEPLEEKDFTEYGMDTITPLTHVTATQTITSDEKYGAGEGKVFSAKVSLKQWGLEVLSIKEL